MKVSRNLLNEFVNLVGIAEETIAKKLTFAGVEVEGFEKLASGTGLVTGEVLTKVRVPDSDHLSLTTVKIGHDNIAQIICGAPNVEVGQKVIVATVGAILPGITIRETMIKGIKSSGMICSLAELGVSNDFVGASEGIFVLPPETEVGREDVLKLLNLDDTIFEIRPLANRSDMLSVYNIARELGALFSLPVTIPTYKDFASFKTNLTLKVSTPLVEAFSLTEVSNLKVGESPLWLKTILEKHGFRPINNIVDVGNYVMLLTGRPLHMYDLDHVKNEYFEVRSDLAIDFIGLGEKEYKLVHGDQIIWDTEKVLCLGGVNGAHVSEITAKTRRIAVEVALFNPAQIRISSTRLNLPSEASSRFGKTVTPFNEEEARLLALHLLKEVSSEIKVSNKVSYQKEAIRQPRIVYDPVYINRLLGTSFSDEEMREALTRLSFSINQDLTINIPAHRLFIEGINDIAEEIIRLLGFEHVASVLPTMATSLGELSPKQKLRLQLRHLLSNLGIYETLNYTLTSEAQNASFPYLHQGTALKLEHPLTPLRTFMRLNILPSLLETVSYNLSRQVNDFGVFEVSNVYSLNHSEEHLAFALTGSEKYNGELVKKPYDFYSAKGIIEALLDYLAIAPSRAKIKALGNEHNYFHPAQSAVLEIGGQVVGVFGKLHPHVLKEYGFKDSVIAGEINFGALLDIKVSAKKVNVPSRFPSVRRDLALLVGRETEVSSLLNLVKKVGGKLVKDAFVFDVYYDLKDKPDLKSVALGIILEDENATLVDKTIKETVDKIIESLVSKLKVEVRS